MHLLALTPSPTIIIGDEGKKEQSLQVYTVLRHKPAVPLGYTRTALSPVDVDPLAIGKECQ